MKSWSITVGRTPATPASRGIECPYTSASRIPTEKPRLRSAIARLTVTEDFPTPPLPEAMPITRVNESGLANGISFSRPPRTIRFTSLRCSSVITPKSRSTLSIPSTVRAAAVTSCCNLSRIGQPAMVSRILIDKRAPSIWSESTIPSSVIGLRNSGSLTRESALRTRSSRELMIYDSRSTSMASQDRT
ncbi:unannotated protein [freshwater metagenome]|uniref:Unannotated protein n=1 Tax=freshwater metagenome TaxID=449393 RepID=A0A6J6ECC5_9ZZZZ